jgi:hypothetical protein
MMPPICSVDRPISFVRCRIVAAVLAAIVLLLSGAARAEEQLLFDFDSRSLSEEWSAIRQITVAREPVPAPSAQAGIVPAGRGARVDTAGRAGLFAKTGKVPRDWRQFESVSLWIYRSPEEARRRPTSIVEIQIYESDGKTRFWRRVDLAHTGWKRFSVPLCWFRYGDQRIPRWDQIDRFGLWFRDAAEVTIDAIAVSRIAAKTASELSAADLASTAFPDAKPEQIRVLEKDYVRIITNAAGLDLQKLADHLKLVAGCVRRDLSLLEEPAVPATLIVFATREQFQAFPDRLAKRMNSSGPVPQAVGFTTHGIGTSYWNDRFGTLRPVYTHEFVHSLVTHGALLRNHGEWFQEGLASYYQMQAHPQESLSRIVIDGIEKGGARLPLSQVLHGRTIPTNRYWQAVTVIEMLITDEKFRTKWPALIAAFQKTGSTDIGPHLEPILETTWEEFEQQWEEHCRRVYGPDDE